MALKATIFKASVNISDMDKHYYESHDLVIARHPSETNQRMMLRILAFILSAERSLQFTKGLSTQDEPDLWAKTDSDEITQWIELGQPDEKRIKKALGLSSNVTVYGIENSTFPNWLSQTKSILSNKDRTQLYTFKPSELEALENTIERSMNFTATIQDNTLWISADHIENNPSFELQPHSPLGL